MTLRQLCSIFAALLTAAGAVNAQDALPLDPYPVDPISAILPQTTRPPSDRPTQLPNIDPRSDIDPLVRPPANSTPAPRPRWNGPPSSYDPSYSYLPDRNPGIRQPPCPCLPLGTWWFNGEYFLGKTQNDSAPPLATQGGSGVPGAPGVNVLQGNSRIDHPFSSGLRIDTGLWMDRCQNWGIEGSFFYMTSSQTNLQASSSGDSLLARPYVQQPGNTPAVDMIAGSGTNRGYIYLDSPLSFMGADANARLNLFCEDRVRIDFLSGYRFIRMSEGLNVHSYSSTFAGAQAGAVSEVYDSFQTVNWFNGGQVGLAGEYRFDRLYLSGSMKVAFGVNSSSLNISGWTRTQTPGGISTIVPTGLLTQASNSGTTSDQQFAVAPEANFSLGYQVSDHWRAFVGYTFLYVSSVSRPGGAIDTSIGTSGSGAVHPTIPAPTTDFWMQGINFGIEARY